ncbi:helix-turn-helix domain-containing protein [Paraburkholderia ferrariae]|uniref:helix-turn-helix domain-containing protein n=1 Tax=Paraburkholderia ferrariae TaxID=386056 RepID=UPI00048574BC|nr:helix-turn-helix domain-containing protein [Paraburkholderia ferrariae]
MDTTLLDPQPAARLMASRALFDALAPSRADACHPAAQFAQAVARVVNGLVAHEVYANAASAASAGGLTPRQARANLARAAACDASPLAALFPAGLATRAFEQRWNALNEAARFGVATTVAAPGTRAAAIHRTPRTREEDNPLRAALSECCIEWLATRSAEDDPTGEQALVSLSLRLGQERGAAHEVAAYLYTEPEADLETCAAELAVTPRTLQRQLARGGLAFGVLRQAVRLTIAGQRLRSRAGSITATAHAAGFYDSAHLTHAWQDACGLTPSAYRAIATIARA